MNFLLVSSAAGRSLNAELQERRAYIPKKSKQKKTVDDNQQLPRYTREGERVRGNAGDNIGLATVEASADTDTDTAINTPSSSHTNSNSSNVCLTDSCFQKTAKSLARAFPDRPDKASWCLQDSTRGTEGLILVKVPKAASSTSAGVALRIADRQNCKALQWQHKPGKTYANRNAEKSFLFTSIRDPASRVISYLFFMEHSIQGQEYSDEWMLDRLQHFSGRYGSIEDGQGGFTMQFASLENIPKYSAWNPKERTVVQNPEAIHKRVQDMMNQYDFMLVVDRMDESLVALALLLNIDVGDVLVTSSKVAGSYFYDPPQHRCVELSKSYISPTVQAYLESDDWKAQNYGDYLLHQAANQSLDLTIEIIGQEKFDAAMQRYQTLKKMEQEQCAQQAQFPCSSDGTPQPKRARKDCYQRDFGCGYQCIDNMIEQLDAVSESKMMEGAAIPFQQFF